MFGVRRLEIQLRLKRGQRVLRADRPSDNMARILVVNTIAASCLYVPTCSVSHDVRHSWSRPPNGPPLRSSSRYQSLLVVGSRKRELAELVLKHENSSTQGADRHFSHLIARLNIPKN